ELLMVRSFLRRTLPLLVLCLLLAAPGVSTAAPRTQSPAGGLLSWLRGALVSLWNGCELDPNGQCVTAATPKNGGQADPFGHCVTSSGTSRAKAGCRLDPFGRCLDGLTTAPMTEAGCQVDPDGRCHN